MNQITAANGAMVGIERALPGQKFKSSVLLPFPSEADVVPTRGFGLDLDGGPDRNAAENWRYQTGFLQFTYSGGMWSLAANTTLPLWQKGQGDAVTIIPGTGVTAWNMTRSETDLYKGGAPVPRDYVFRIRSIGFALGAPFIMPPEGSAYFVKDAVLHYGETLLTRLWDVLGVQLSFNEEACSYELGLAQFHAMPAGKVSANEKHFRAGAGMGVMGMLPLRGSVWAGARDEANQLTVNVTSPAIGLAFEENPAYPVGEDIFVPVTFQAYGQSYISCPPAVCAPANGGLTAADVEAIAKQVLAGARG